MCYINHTNIINKYKTNDERYSRTGGPEKVYLEELGRITSTSERIYPNAGGQQTQAFGNSAKELDEAYAEREVIWGE